MSDDATCAVLVSEPFIGTVRPRLVIKALATLSCVYLLRATLGRIALQARQPRQALAGKDRTRLELRNGTIKLRLPWVRLAID